MTPAVATTRGALEAVKEHSWGIFKWQPALSRLALTYTSGLTSRTPRKSPHSDPHPEALSSPCRARVWPVFPHLLPGIPLMLPHHSLLPGAFPKALLPRRLVWVSAMAPTTASPGSMQVCLSLNCGPSGSLATAGAAGRPGHRDQWKGLGLKDQE